MLRDIEIKNFRGINFFKIYNFKKINLFVGNNNCGKTSLLEALFLLIGASNPDLIIRVNAFREILKIDSGFWLSLFPKLSAQGLPVISGNFLFPKEKRTLTLRPIRGPQPNTTPNQKGKKSISSSGIAKTEIETTGLNLEFKQTKGSKSKKQKIIKTSIRFQQGEFQAQFVNDYTENRRAIFQNNRTIHSDMAKRFDTILLSKKTPELVSILKKFDP